MEEREGGREREKEREREKGGGATSTLVAEINIHCNAHQPAVSSRKLARATDQQKGARALSTISRSQTLQRFEVMLAVYGEPAIDNRHCSA